MMVDELHNDLPHLLIPAPIGRDRRRGLSWNPQYMGDFVYVLNPGHSKPQTLQQLQFFGAFLGVAIRYLPVIREPHTQTIAHPRARARTHAHTNCDSEMVS